MSIKALSVLGCAAMMLTGAIADEPTCKDEVVKVVPSCCETEVSPQETARKVAAVLCNILYDIETPETLMMRLESSPHAKALLKRVQQQRREKDLPPITVRFVTKQEVAENPIGFIGGARVFPTTGEILLAPDLSRQERLAGLLFELANLSQMGRYQAICADVREKRLTSPYIYALRLEKLEFDSAAIAKEITLQSVVASEWDISMLTTIHSAKTFEEWWAAVIKSGHAQQYVQRFKRLYSEPSATT